MKTCFSAIALLLLLNVNAYSKTQLFESKYFSFQSSKQLNAHLFLYNKAIGCKFGKRPADSLAFYSFKEKFSELKPKEISELNAIILYYRDSLVTKDLLFDNSMSEFSDILSSNDKAINLKTEWQNAALIKIKAFEPYFNKLYWKAIDSTNNAWLTSNKAQIASLETTVMPELERIYQMKLPTPKIRVDLTCYATWAGAYSFKNSFEHIVFSSGHKSNQGDLATEVIFHEASHFLVDKLNEKIATLAKEKKVTQELSLWHNVIFYTTGSVLEKEHAKQNKKFTPYYVQMKFEDKFPDFKKSVEACRKYWDPYISGKINFDDAVLNMVNYVIL